MCSIAVLEPSNFLGQILPSSYRSPSLEQTPPQFQPCTAMMRDHLMQLNLLLFISPRDTRLLELHGQNAHINKHL